MTERLRVVTLNIHKGLSQFNRRMVIHELREGLRTLDPDLMFLQEVQGLNERNALRFAGWPGAPQHEYLAEERWQHAYGRNAIYDHGHHGNAILSRFPIVSAETEDVSNHRFERRGLLHCVVTVPGWRRNLHCVCVHLSLHERGRRRQIEAIGERLESLASRNLPIIVGGDFNDWRYRAAHELAHPLNLYEVFELTNGAPARSFPAVLPVMSLDRIYVRGFQVRHAHVHHGRAWARISDHAALAATLIRG